VAEFAGRASCASEGADAPSAGGQRIARLPAHRAECFRELTGRAPKTVRTVHEEVEPRIQTGNTQNPGLLGESLPQSLYSQLPERQLRVATLASPAAAETDPGSKRRLLTAVRSRRSDGSHAVSAFPNRRDRSSPPNGGAERKGERKPRNAPHEGRSPSAGVLRGRLGATKTAV